jgi:Sulfotransferase family
MTMPNFLIIGAQKSGTTSLYRYLRQHPEIYMSPVKEPRFFAFEGDEPDFRGPLRRDPRTPWAGRPRGTVTDLGAYCDLFRGVTDEAAVGEASPYYLYSEKAPGRIRHHLPEAKMIAILRDPVERAYSQFLMERRNGQEPLADFRKALAAEERRARDNWWIGQYRSRGFYHAQLDRYLKLFHPDQLRVYLYEDLEEDPVGMTHDIFRFLEVDDTFVPDTSWRSNVSGIPRSRALQTFAEQPNRLKGALKQFLPEGLLKRMSANLRQRNLAKPPPMPESARRELTVAYREDVAKLQRLIGRDLSRWRGEGGSRRTAR